MSILQTAQSDDSLITLEEIFDEHPALKDLEDPSRYNEKLAAWGRRLDDFFDKHIVEFELRTNYPLFSLLEKHKQEFWHLLDSKYTKSGSLPNMAMGIYREQIQSIRAQISELKAQLKRLDPESESG